jgi:nitrogenase-stabilizing/protective protein
MKSVKDFEKITDANQYFEFFDIEYDERLLNAKRFHILKLFGNLIKNAPDIDDEQKVAFYRFCLLRVYGDFVNGIHPSAADVFNMYEKTGGCLSCSTSTCETTGACSTPSFIEDANNVA